MWIVRFHKLQTKDYNKIARLLKKAGFTTRRTSSIIYGKALIRHIIQKRSLRSTAQEFSVSHISLHKFFHFIRDKDEFSKIFHVFLESRSIVFLENTRSFNQDDLDNSKEIYTLTKKVVESMLKK